MHQIGPGTAGKGKGTMPTWIYKESDTYPEVSVLAACTCMKKSCKGSPVLVVQSPGRPETYHSPLGGQFPSEIGKVFVNPELRPCLTSALRLDATREYLL